jgi:hypothetical protein
MELLAMQTTHLAPRALTEVGFIEQVMACGYRLSGLLMPTVTL